MSLAAAPGLAILVAAGAGVAASFGPRLVLGGLLIAVVTVMLLRLALSGDLGDTTFLLYVFLAGVTIRMTVAVLTYKLLPYGYFAPDEDEYSSYLGTFGFPTPTDAILGSRGWFYFNALVSQFFGPDAPLLMRLWNCAVGSLVSLLCYRLARSLSTRSAARLTSVFVTLCPSLVLWSSLNLKDADAHALILASLLIGFLIQRTRRLRYLPLLALTLFAAASLRQYLLVPLLAAILVAQVIPRRGPSGHLFMAGIAGGALLIPLILSVPELSSWTPRLVNVDAISLYRRGFASGSGSAYLAQQSFDSPFAVVTFLPAALVYFLLGPFPWTSGSLLQTLTTPEMLVYYVLIPFAIVGIRRTVSRSPRVAVPLVVFAAITAVSYALIISNFGAAFRFRDQLLIIVLCFGATGLTSLRSGQLSERPAPPASAATA